MSETLISVDRFQFYSDYFAFAAESGLKSAQSLFPTVASAASVDVRTFSYFVEAITTKNSLVGNLRSSYEQVFINAFSLEPMRDAFLNLADHVKKFTGGTLDDYLADNNIQVEGVYARISNLTGNTVSSSNIK